MDVDRHQRACALDCPDCPSSASPSSESLPEAPASRLTGARFALACALVFLVPPLTWIAAQILWAEALGELPAAAVGLFLSAGVLLPAAWFLRRR